MSSQSRHTSEHAESASTSPLRKSVTIRMSSGGILKGKRQRQMLDRIIGMSWSRGNVIMNFVPENLHSYPTGAKRRS